MICGMFVFMYEGYYYIPYSVGLEKHASLSIKNSQIGSLNCPYFYMFG